MPVQFIHNSNHLSIVKRGANLINATFSYHISGNVFISRKSCSMHQLDCYFNWIKIRLEASVTRSRKLTALPQVFYRLLRVTTGCYGLLRVATGCHGRMGMTRWGMFPTKQEKLQEKWNKKKPKRENNAFMYSSCITSSFSVDLTQVDWISAWWWVE